MACGIAHHAERADGRSLHSVAPDGRDHLTYQCVDYKKAAAFYATLRGWKVRSDDGKQCVLDIGENSGGIIIRGGLTTPPPAAITDAGLGVTRPPVQAVFDGFAWGIDKWDTKKVEAELSKRGLNPVADHDAKNDHNKRFHQA